MNPPFQPTRNSGKTIRNGGTEWVILLILALASGLFGGGSVSSAGELPIQPMSLSDSFLWDEIVIELPNLPLEAKPLTLVRVPAGSFRMGSLDIEQGRNAVEGPAHHVSIGYAFYMGKYPITQAQWQAVMGTNPSYFRHCGIDCPVEQVSWDDIRGKNGFLDRLNNLGQGPFRLPSEAEWEYACRAGSTTRFFFGDSLECGDVCEDCSAGVLPGNRSDYMWFCGSSTPNGTNPVGEKKPNAFGLHDMSGNVLEWCEDDWHWSYIGAPSDGFPWVELPRTESRVIRGGGWDYIARFCRSANRFIYHPLGKVNNLGFRLVTVFSDIPPVPNPDVDGDGIPNALEGGIAPLPGRSNRYLSDSDGDGLWDGIEDSNRNGVRDPGETDTRNRDSDRDGFEDGIEVFYTGSDPLDIAKPGIRFVDTDGDALPDFLDPNLLSADLDGDRFPDSYEAVTGGMASVGNPLQRPTLGDVNGNEFWDNGDSQIILKFIAHLPTVEGFDFTRTDLDRNGAIDNADAQHSLNYFGGMIPHLPAVAAPPLPREITLLLPDLSPDALPLTLVHIPSGVFEMGSLEDSSWSWCLPCERPPHLVTIGYDYYMGKYPITQAQWVAMMGANPARDYGVGNDYPVYFVSWNEIREENGFLDRLNALGQGTFRLPSEAEWEYACRAGSMTRFFFGDSDCQPNGCDPCNLVHYGWFCGSYPPDGTKPVGQLLANGFGLFDMYGNVWEWCEDYWHDRYTNAPLDGSPWLSPSSSQRVMRGGYWGSNPRFCHSASRSRNSPSNRTNFNGFRIVLEISRK